MLIAFLAAAHSGRAAQIGDLPGEDISSGEVEKSQTKVKAEAKPVIKSTNWLTPPVEEQLSRDRTLIPLGKGAVFVPTYSEPRREPEVSIYTLGGKLVKSGQTGERILLDSGFYTLRLGSGTSIQQIPVDVTVEEGHTTVIPPDWAGLIVETMTGDGDYIDGQYEVIRMDKWINFGKGHGLKQERLQDIRTWLLPPGLYRISKPGEGFNSLRNYITVQLNPGELSQVEVIYDKTSGDIISGGLKSLDARKKAGSYWSYGLRAGGNVNLSRQTSQEDVRKETMQVSSDLRLRANFDNVRYLGISEVFLQDIFSKERGRRFSVTSDIAQLRTTWIRRLNEWLGPYIRTTVDTHVFPRYSDKDTVKIFVTVDSSGTPVQRFSTDTSGDFLISPAFDPVELAEGIGINVEMLSKYYLEASTQIGFSARQNLVDYSYSANSNGDFFRSKSAYEIGVESNLNATVRLGSQMALDLRTELFAPNASLSRLRLVDLTADFRFFLSRNLEVGYLYQVKEQLEDVKNRFPSTHNLSLRLSFNF
ncbi:MAG: ABC-type uncharacterized transport system, auxiliary component [Fibrobacteres bacterium]|nr:ABC-type uncharacterized transport system, auxiliary component [Fibrobacterota bacterium]